MNRFVERHSAERYQKDQNFLNTFSTAAGIVLGVTTLFILISLFTLSF